MKKNKMCLVVAALSVVCMVSICSYVRGATFSESISFGANHLRGYATNYHSVDVSPSYGFRTKMTGINFVGMPSGLMPVNSSINFRLYTSKTDGADASYVTTHVYNDISIGTWNKAKFYSSVNHSYGTSFVMASNASGTNRAGTVNYNWKYY